MRRPSLHHDTRSEKLYFPPPSPFALPPSSFRRASDGEDPARGRRWITTRVPAPTSRHRRRRARRARRDDDGGDDATRAPRPFTPQPGSTPWTSPSPTTTRRPVRRRRRPRFVSTLTRTISSTTVTHRAVTHRASGPQTRSSPTQERPRRRRRRTRRKHSCANATRAKKGEPRRRRSGSRGGARGAPTMRPLRRPRHRGSPG